MKFGNLFEFHKIPEWYHEYLDYKGLADRCKEYRKQVRKAKREKLSGIFYLTESKKVVDIPIFEKLQ